MLSNNSKRKYYLLGALCVIAIAAVLHVLVLDKHFKSDLSTEPSIKTPSSIWKRVSPEDEILKLLTTAIKKQPGNVIKRWSQQAIKDVAAVTSFFSYDVGAVDHYTALAVVYHESGFKPNLVSTNPSKKGRPSSYDYYLTQQNSLAVVDRYYSLKSFLGSLETSSPVKKLLLSRMQGKYKVEKIKDPAVNIALMFETFRECKRLLGNRSENTSRMVLCYNHPVHALKRKKDLVKVPYVKDVLKRRAELAKLI